MKYLVYAQKPGGKPFIVDDFDTREAAEAAIVSYKEDWKDDEEEKDNVYWIEVVDKLEIHL